MDLYLRHLLEERAKSLRLYNDAMATVYRLEEQGRTNPPHIRLAENALTRIDEYEKTIAKKYPTFNGPWFVVETKITGRFVQDNQYTYIEVDHK